VLSDDVRGDRKASRPGASVVAPPSSALSAAQSPDWSAPGTLAGGGEGQQRWLLCLAPGRKQGLLAASLKRTRELQGLELRVYGVADLVITVTRHDQDRITEQIGAWPPPAATPTAWAPPPPPLVRVIPLTTMSSTGRALDAGVAPPRRRAGPRRGGGKLPAGPLSKPRSSPGLCEPHAGGVRVQHEDLLAVENHLPLVTTSFGSSGLPPGAAAAVYEDPRDLAAAVVALHSDVTRWGRAVAAAYKAASAAFSEDAVALRWQEALQEAHLLGHGKLAAAQATRDLLQVLVPDESGRTSLLSIV